MTLLEQSMEKASNNGHGMPQSLDGGAALPHGAMGLSAVCDCGIS